VFTERTSVGLDVHARSIMGCGLDTVSGAVGLFAEVARALPDTPLIGCGGIMDADDAREYLAAGARAVQVGTALFHDPTTAFRIAREIGPQTEPPAGEDDR